MTLEEDERMMRAAGNVLRKGIGPNGKAMEYWDIPRTVAETHEANEIASKLKTAERAEKTTNGAA